MRKGFPDSIPTHAEKLTDQPHKHIIPVFGATIQYAKAVDTSNKLDDNRNKIIQ